MARNVLEMMFRLDGTMGGGLKTATTQTAQRLQDLNKKTLALKKTAKDVDGFQKLRASTLSSQNALRVARAKLAGLKSEIQKTEKPSARLTSQFQRARIAVGELNFKYTTQRAKLAALRTTIHGAGLSTKDLAGSSTNLARQLANVDHEAQSVRGHLAKLEAQERRSATTRQASMPSLMGYARSLAALAAGYVGVQTGLSIIGGAGEFEQASIAFEVMLRSADKAKQLMKELYTFSAETPFEFPEIQESAKSLLAFGIPAEEVTKKLRMLGDISSGVNQPLTDIAVIFGKARVAGRLYAEDVYQLTERGIPIIAEFAKQFHVAEPKVRKLVEKGKIGFKDLDRAMTALTTGQGRFAGMTDRQSRSLLGLWSTLKDGIRMTFIDEANEALPSLKRLLKYGIDNTPKLAEAVDKLAKRTIDMGKSAIRAYTWYQKHLRPLTPVIVGVTGALVGLELATRAMVVWDGRAAAAAKLREGALLRLNTVTRMLRFSTSPLGLAIIGAGGLVYALNRWATVSRDTTLDMKSLKNMTDETRDAVDEFGDSIKRIPEFRLPHYKQTLETQAQEAWQSYSASKKKIESFKARPLTLPESWWPSWSTGGQMRKEATEARSEYNRVFRRLEATRAIIRENKEKAREAGAGKPKSGAQRHALGGIVTKPTLSWIGEQGSEAVIPLDNHRARAQALYRQTGEKLGFGGPLLDIQALAEKLFAGPGRSPALAGAGHPIVIEVHQTFNGNTSPADVRTAAESSFQSIAGHLGRILRDDRRRSMD